MSVRIVVDSTCDLIPELRERVRIAPLTVYFGDEEYIDGVTLEKLMRLNEDKVDEYLELFVKLQCMETGSFFE